MSNHSNDSNTSHVLKNRSLSDNMMRNHKSVTLSKDNIERMTKLGFAGESVNDVISKMLEISEPQLRQEMERTFFQHQRLASSRREQQQEQAETEK